jgi:hypothetical protein
MPICFKKKRTSKRIWEFTRKYKVRNRIWAFTRKENLGNYRYR